MSNNFDLKLLKDGDNILVHTNGFSFVSIGIRLLTHSFWNHVGKYVIKDNKGYIIEAEFKGVKLNPIEKYFGNKKYTLKAVRLAKSAFSDDEEYNKGIKISVNKMFQLIEFKYDFGALIWLGAVYLSKGITNKLLSIFKCNPLQSRNRFFCSESVCSSEKTISSIIDNFYRGTTNQNCSNVTPKDIAKSPWTLHITGVNKI